MSDPKALCRERRLVDLIAGLDWPGSATATQQQPLKDTPTAGDGVARATDVNPSSSAASAHPLTDTTAADSGTAGGTISRQQCGQMATSSTTLGYQGLYRPAAVHETSLPNLGPSSSSFGDLVTTNISRARSTSIARTLLAVKPGASSPARKSPFHKSADASPTWNVYSAALVTPLEELVERHRQLGDALAQGRSSSGTVGVDSRPLLGKSAHPQQRSLSSSHSLSTVLDLWQRTSGPSAQQGSPAFATLRPRGPTRQDGTGAASHRHSPSYVERAFAACFFGRLEDLRLLLTAHPDLVWARDTRGRTLLHEASASGRSLCVSLLLDHGLSPDELDALNETPAMVARRCGWQHVDRLFQRKAGSNLQRRSPAVAPRRQKKVRDQLRAHVAALANYAPTTEEVRLSAPAPHDQVGSVAVHGDACLEITDKQRSLVPLAGRVHPRQHRSSSSVPSPKQEPFTSPDRSKRLEKDRQRSQSSVDTGRADIPHARAVLAKPSGTASLPSTTALTSSTAAASTDTHSVDRYSHSFAPALDGATTLKSMPSPYQPADRPGPNSSRAESKTSTSAIRGHVSSLSSTETALHTALPSAQTADAKGQNSEVGSSSLPSQSDSPPLTVPSSASSLEQSTPPAGLAGENAVSRTAAKTLLQPQQEPAANSHSTDPFRCHETLAAQPGLTSEDQHSDTVSDSAADGQVPVAEHDSPAVLYDAGTVPQNDISPRDPTPLLDAAQMHAEQALLHALGTGIPIDAQDKRGRTAMHVAIRHGHHKMLDLLLSLGAPVSLADNSGNTPLHVACSLGWTVMTEQLLRHGADPMVKNRAGKSCVDVARVKIRKMFFDASQQVADGTTTSALDGNEDIDDGGEHLSDGRAASSAGDGVNSPSSLLSEPGVSAGLKGATRTPLSRPGSSASSSSVKSGAKRKRATEFRPVTSPAYDSHSAGHQQFSASHSEETHSGLPDSLPSRPSSSSGGSLPAAKRRKPKARRAPPSPEKERMAARWRTWKDQGFVIEDVVVVDDFEVRSYAPPPSLADRS